jgi:hypothetical protein
MEPASTIIALFGGSPAISEVLGIPKRTPYNWAIAKAKGGTGGLIPQKHHLALLAEANRRHLSLTAEDFLPRQTDNSAAQ